MPRTARIAAAAAAALALVACGKDRGDRAAAAETAPEPAMAEAQAPRVKEFRPTDQAALGTAPDGKGLALGDPIPAVTVRDLDDRPVALDQVAGGKPLLVQFYRGGWCPYCNFQVRATASSLREFETRGVEPVFISVDKPDAAARTRATYEVAFPLLSDAELAAHEAFHVVEHNPEPRPDRPDTYAIPSLFLFDAGGKLVWQHVDPEYKVRPRLEQVLTVLDEQGYRAPE